MPSVAIAWAPAASVLPAPRRSTGLRRGIPGSRLRIIGFAQVQTAEAPAAAAVAPPPTPAAPAHPQPAEVEEAVKTARVAFIVPHLRLPFGENLRLVGGGPCLGDWSAAAAPEMTWHEGDVWTALVDLTPGDHIFKLAVYSQAGETYWEEGANRSLHVPLACVPLTAEDPGQLVKAVCAWGETAGTRLQPNELGAENLRASLNAAETALAELLYQKAMRQQDSRLDAAIAQQTAELERMKEAHQAREEAAEAALAALLYQREARTGTELAGRIMALKARIERLQEAQRTLDALALECGAWAQPAVQPWHGL